MHIIVFFRGRNIQRQLKRKHSPNAHNGLDQAEAVSQECNPDPPHRWKEPNSLPSPLPSKFLNSRQPELEQGTEPKL